MCVVKTASWPVRALTRTQSRWRHTLRMHGIGHRAAFLMGFGAIFVAIGLLVVLAPAPPDRFLFHTRFWPWARVLLWCGTGAVAVLTARSRVQWAGFAALTLAPMERTISYLVGAVLASAVEFPPWPYLTLGAMFGMLFFVVTLCASWPDPPTDPQQPHGAGRGAPPWLRRLTRLLQGRTAA